MPERAIVYVDTVIHPLLDGNLSLYLPLGRHVCRIESPFYQTLNDTIELTDIVRFEKRYVLQPFYAYLTVETDWPDARICLDGDSLGLQRVETSRLMPGRYRLTVNLVIRSTTSSGWSWRTLSARWLICMASNCVRSYSWDSP